MKAAVRVKPAQQRSGDVRLPAAVAQALATPGEALDAEVRGEMEQRLGHRLGHIRIHADARAAAAASTLDSLAFSSGAHIVFADGRYQPHTTEGQRLLAHELAHTLQQSASTPAGLRQSGGTDSAGSLQVSVPAATPPDPLEAEADAVADRVAAGRTLPAGMVSVGAPAARGRIARRAREAIAHAPGQDSVEDVEAVADDVARLLLFDPHDTFGRVKRRLAPLAPETREAVAAAVRDRVTGPAAAQLAAILVELRPHEAGPPPVPEPADRPAAQAGPAAPDVERPGPIEALGRLWQAVLGRLRPSRETSELETPDRRASKPPAAATATATATATAATETETRTGTEARTETEQPPEQIAREAVAGLAAREVESAPTEAGPDGAATPAAPDAAATRADPARQPAGAEETAGETAEETAGKTPGNTSESGEVVDPRVAEVATVDQEDRDDEAPTAESSTAESPTGEFSTAESPVPEEPATAGPEPTSTPEPSPATVPDLASAGRDPGADPATADQPSDAEHQVAAETTSDAIGEESAEAAGTAGLDTDQPESGQPAAPTGDTLSVQDPEQTAAEPAAEPTIGPVELGPVAEVEPSEDAPDVGGGAGGGAPVEGQAPADVPDVSGGEPEAGIDTVAALPPTAAAQALGGVQAATTRSVATKRDELVAAPPQLERPTGAPTRAEAAVEAPAPAARPPSPAMLGRLPAASSVPTPTPTQLPPAPPAPIWAVPPLRVGGTTAPMTEADLATVRGSIKSLPTTDPALAITAGSPPTLALRGDADPARAGEQRGELDKAAVAARTEGAVDAAAPMGEAAVLPTVPPETLRAAIVSAPAPAAAAVESPGTPDPAVDAFIAERRPGEMRAAAATARAEMATERQKRAQSTQTAGVEARANIEQEVAQNAAAQRTARDDLRRDVREQRDQWNAAQQDLVATTQTDADTANAKLTTEVASETEKGTTAADRQIAEGDAKAVIAREEAEGKARAARSRGEAEPTGFLGWVSSQATAFFEGIKTSIKDAFEAGRKAVKQAIETAQKLAAEAIESSRKAVVAAIKAAGEALIEIGGRLLAGFPRLRTKFRGAIRAAVGLAERAVNALAEGLKVAVQAWLNLYAKVLDGILGLLEAGLLAVVTGWAASVQGLIRIAQFVLNGLGDLVQVARDVASGPLAWLRNFRDAIIDGVRNHLWSTLKATIAEWFDAKVDAVLGLGKTIWNVLAKGGITVAAVAKFAFAALKKVIPIVLIKLLITKLIGLLVPAAAAVMAIIEALQAAWGAAGSIIGAISKFIAFLKAVKGGNAGPQFAEAVAAAAVAVIEFVSFWLLRRLLKAAAKVGRAIKGVATKIAAMLTRLVKALKRGVKKLARRGKAWMLKMGRRFRRFKERIFGKRKKKSKRQSQQERLDRAVAAIKPPLDAMLRRGTSSLVLWSRLRWWQLRWWLSSVSASSSGEITARINPSRPLSRSRKVKIGADLEQILIRAENEYFRDFAARSPRVEEAENVLKRGATGMPVPGKPVPGMTPPAEWKAPILPELSRAEQVYLGRRIQAGETPAWGLLPPPTAGKGFRGWLRFGGDESPGGQMSLKQQFAFATAEVKIRGSRGRYEHIAPAMKRAALAAGVSETELLGAIRAPSPAASRAVLAALAAGRTPAQQAVLTHFVRSAESVGFLTQAVEPIRAPGMFAAAGIGQHVAGSAASVLGPSAIFGPMTPMNAAAAASVEQRMRRMAGLTPAGRRSVVENDLPGFEGKGPSAREQRKAIDQRRARLTMMFMRLRRVVARGEIEALAGAEAPAMRRIAKAFDAWLTLRLKRTDPDQLEAAATALEVQITTWMQSFYG